MNRRVRGVIAARNCCGGDFKFCFVAGLEDDRCRGGELHHFGIAQPIWRRNNHFIAFFAGGEDDVVAGMFAAARETMICDAL